MQVAPMPQDMGQHTSERQLINPRCLAATCGAFGVFALAAAATQMRPASTANVNESTTLDEESEDDEDKPDEESEDDEDKPKQPLTGKRILLLCTSSNKVEKEGKSHATGVWLDEAATPYYLFRKAGAKVTIASPAGGEIPIDAASMKGAFFTDAAKKFLKDPIAKRKMKKSRKLASCDADNFDGLYCAGGHGATVDYRKARHVVEEMFEANKPIAFDCHGPVALYHAKDENGDPIVKGKTVTGFSDSEEKAVGMDKMVKAPETRLKRLGAHYTKGKDWTSHVEQDGNLITGQNPQSSAACANLLIKALGK
jgi:putative intracellular protease/amidase